MKKLLIVLFATLPLWSFAQTDTTLTPEQRLEQAKKAAAEAKQAIKDAKRQAKEQEKLNKKRAKIEKQIAEQEAEAARLQQEAEAARARLGNTPTATVKQQTEPVKQQPLVLKEEKTTTKSEPVVVKEEKTPVKTEPIVVKEEKTKQETAPATQVRKKTQPIPPLSEAKPKDDESIRQLSEKPVASQQGGWVAVTEKATPKAKKEEGAVYYNAKESDARYMQGAVPEVDGKVVFTLDEVVPHKSASEIYQTVYNYMYQMTGDEQQREKGKSRIALVNESEGVIAGIYEEWIVFSSSFISLDRTQFNYTLVAECKDEHLHMTLERITYLYEEGRDTELKTTAERWISDDESFTKKGSLMKQPGKFRRKTIDRKDQIFNGIKEALQIK